MDADIREGCPFPIYPCYSVSIRVSEIFFMSSKELEKPRNAGSYSPVFSAARKADWGISTLPNWRIFFFPFFCFSSSFFFRVMSPP